MGKKRDKANENIEILVDELVSLKISSLGCDCTYWREPKLRKERCINSCSDCKEIYGEYLRKEMLDKYLVK